MPVVERESGPSRPRLPQSNHHGIKGQKKALPSHKPKKVRRSNEYDALRALEDAATNFVPPEDLQSFPDLPMSIPTKKGLKKAYFTKMTDIQHKSIPDALKSRDILGAARTGSGKTLAFLIPVLEILYRRKWGPQDGLGALIISPTRELAMQIFDVLRAIGGFHSFSAGLVIGGKNLKDERDRLTRMNILVATPGRLLQHMDQTAGFECDNLQMLVLDEADRILDMGFAKTLNAIVANLPPSRQTLLFSATQTQSVKDLARLSLKEPLYVSVREKDHEGATPKNLEQHYLVCDLDKKLDVLYSFLKAHLKVKALVFMSSCKQVRYVFETFRKLQPGIPLLHLHGKQKQTKRVEIFQKFTTTKHAVMFATDIAARGLDFPSVDWVVQLDAPEDADTYIHRVGRTARYESKGKGLLFLLPSEEEGMLAELKRKEVEVERIKVKDSKTTSIQNSLQSFAFQDPEIKYLGQRAFVSYLRSIHLQKNKSVFKVDQLPLKAFAASLGLPGAPKVKFISNEIAKQKKNAVKVVDAQDHLENGEDDLSDATSEDPDEEEETRPLRPESVGEAQKVPAVRTKYDRMFERKNQGILSEHYNKLVDHAVDGDLNQEEDFITLKRADHELDDPTPTSFDLSKRKIKEGESRKAMLKYHPNPTKLRFDDEGKPHALYEMENDEEFRKQDVVQAGRAFAEAERGKMRDVDVVDKELAKEKKREKKRKRKERERGEDADDDVGPTIAPVEDDGYESPEFDLPPLSDEEGSIDDSPPPPAKKRRKESRTDEGDALRDDEELALRLLQGSR